MSPARTRPGEGPRGILRQLHDVMAISGSAPSKLKKVVKAIARGLQSEVCSIYLLRDTALELFATQGLAQEAVHVTKLNYGQGLVGNIAERGVPLNLAEAKTHPDYVYRPETGEEVFHSFAGVPILRAGQSVGVLCVQHVEPRDYTDEEIETLQTVAMVLAELIVAAGLIDDSTLAKSRALLSGPQRLPGFKLVDGVARGTAVYHQPRVVIEHTVAEDVEVEKARLKSAFLTMREQIDRMLNQSEFAGAGDHAEVLETYKMFAFDEGWVRRINEAIDSGLTAEAAIERVQQRTRANMRKTQDAYLLERLQDLDDLSNRLIRIVAGQMGTAAQTAMAADAILIARNLGPAELLEYDRRRLKAVILEEGSLTAHVTIIARAMGVPMIGRVKDVRSAVAEGDPLIVDVGNEAVFVRPTPDVIKSFETNLALRTKRLAGFAAARELRPVTKDGVDIQLMMNAGLRSDLDALHATNADGIGLFRTEFQFLVSATLPRRQAQTRLYQDVLESVGRKPVVFRTVDIGGDKAVSYLDRDAEENPAMGWRALRLALERSSLLKVQARALLEAAVDRDLNLMFPMVTEPWEFAAAKQVVLDELKLARERGEGMPRSIRYGAMLEVPGLAFRLDSLLPQVDFLSIGTNDLTQFLFAADRSNPKLAKRYDWLSPTVLRFLRFVIGQADAAKVPVSVCGEMGGRELEAMALLGLGVRRLSITPIAVGPIRAMVRSIEMAPLTRMLAELLDQPDGDVRGALTDYASSCGVVLP